MGHHPSSGQVVLAVVPEHARGGLDPQLAVDDLELDALAVLPLQQRGRQTALAVPDRAGRAELGPGIDVGDPRVGKGRRQLGQEPGRGRLAAEGDLPERG